MSGETVTSLAVLFTQRPRKTVAIFGHWTIHRTVFDSRKKKDISGLVTDPVQKEKWMLGGTLLGFLAVTANMSLRVEEEDQSELSLLTWNGALCSVTKGSLSPLQPLCQHSALGHPQ